MQYIIQATGRRKKATASVRFKEGSGLILINNKKLDTFFPLFHLQATVKEPLKAVEKQTSYDIYVSVRGGGTTGQAEASRHAIARALVKINPEYRPLLKKDKLLTRDPRMVERKKYGRPKARKKFTFNKR